MKEIKGTLEVHIKSREKTYFDGEAKAVTSNNDDGVFDVLPHHANFITMIKDFVKVHQKGEEAKEFEISNGVYVYLKALSTFFLPFLSCDILILISGYITIFVIY